MTSTVSTTAPVTTGLYIGGHERSTDDVLEVIDPARPGVVVGRAAAATKEDVADAVAAAKAAYPAWSALSATERAAQMAAAIEGLADERDEDARILSLENGKIVHEARSESTRLNSSHANISYAVFCLKKKTKQHTHITL